MTTNDKYLQIARLNDLFRRSFSGGRVMTTDGAQSLGPELLAEALNAVRCFNQFDQLNDPHNEHDFGRIDVGGYELFWKIDYYDATLTFHSPDAADPNRTVRVLTLMLAEEY